MENLVYGFVIAAIAFWLGRKTKPAPLPSDIPFEHSPIQTPHVLPGKGGPKMPMTGARLAMLVFIFGWIVAWSAGIVMAVVMFLNTFGSGVATLFIGGWIIAALVGWVFAASTIYKLATGQPVQSRGRII